MNGRASRDSLFTRRLELRPFRDEDAADAQTWFGDPEVMRFTPSGPDASMQATASRLTSYIEHQQRHGFSKWIAVDRATRRPVGDAGLMFLHGTEDVELGYRLKRALWGHGLATELALAWRQHAFEVLRLSSLVAFTHPENASSIRVLHKCGFVLDRHDRVLGMDAVVFRATSDRRVAAEPAT